MKVRACEKQEPWEATAGAWFHEHRGEAFEVLAIYANPQRLYQVDVRDLAKKGEIATDEAFIPHRFAELLGS